ncbi:MAG: carboxypeptidase-like regulatory domain-containing protein [Planctomycetes bacterium]|nr:carboxypeptidase-like regulatory domain-containing protein [Planctomycetota bacterium]
MVPVLAALILACWPSGDTMAPVVVDVELSPSQESTGPEATTDGPTEPQRATAALEPTVAEHPEPTSIIDVVTDLRVLVHDARGTPVEGMDVAVVVHAAPPHRALGATAVDGVWTTRLQMTGTTAVSTTVALANGASRRITVRPGAVAEVTFVLEADVTVSGRVLDPAGTPVGGALVYSAPPTTVQHRIRTSPRAVSDAEGRYTVRHLAHRSFLGARAEGHAASALYVLGDEAVRDGAVQLDLVVGDGGATIHGRIVDARGLPVEGASVVAMSREGARWRPVRVGISALAWQRVCTVSDRDGAFVIAGQTPGTTTIAAWTVDQPRVEQEVTLVRGQTATVVLRLPDAAHVAGVVRGPDGSPLSDVAVQCTDRLPHDETTPVAYSDSDGAYHLTGLPLGSVRLRASADGMSAVSCVAEASMGGSKHDFVLRPAPRINGRVLDERGSAAVGVWVQGREPGTRRPASKRQQTGDDGSFSLACYSEGVVEIDVRWEDSAVDTPAVAVVPCPSSGVVLRIESSSTSGATLCGRIRLDTPATSLGLQVRRVGVTPILRSLERPRADGTFDSRPLPPGTYELVLQIDFERAVEFGPFTLSAGERRNLGELVVTAAAAK